VTGCTAKPSVNAKLKPTCWTDPPSRLRGGAGHRRDGLVGYLVENPFAHPVSRRKNAL
jgi:hypothetical protein